jgi:hypothetical protein
MPDPLFLLAVMAGAAAVAAVVVLVCAWPWRTPDPTRLAIGEALGIGLAFFLGCGVVERWPRWPLAEAQDRLLVLVLPALVLAEIFAAWQRVPPWLAWALRLAVAAAVTPLLLYNSRYLADSAGPGTRLWTPGQVAAWLGGLAGALAVVWGLLSLLGRRTPGRSLPLAVAVVCMGAAPTIMYSGYLTGGPLLVPLAGALIGVAAASLAWTPLRTESAAVGVAITILFAVLAMGRFFGELSTLNAGLVLFAPLLAWLPELPRPLLRIILVAAPVALALLLAQQPTGRDTAPGRAKEPSLEDYQQFGR